MTTPRVLVVEDEAIAARAARVMLERSGCEVCGTVDTGEEAIAAARSGVPDLVLMDVRLKGPLSGIEAASVIRGELGIPVVFVSAYRRGEGGLAAPEDAPWLSKPIGERELAAAVARVLGRGRP
jgi:CheY-like chemotaxis protein